MFKNTLTLTVSAALLCGLSMSNTAQAQLLDREQNSALFAAASGKHWYLDHQRWYQFNWQSDGSVTVARMNAKAEDKPIAEGKWHVKEVEKKEGMTDGDVEAANAGLTFVYCQQLDNLWSGHEHCWDVYQTSADMTADEKPQPLPRQEYAFHRDGGGEYSGYVITRR